MYLLVSFHFNKSRKCNSLTVVSFNFNIVSLDLGWDGRSSWGEKWGHQKLKLKKLSPH
jgi:hypothetical protein